MSIRALALALTVAWGCGHAASPDKPAPAQPSVDVGARAPDAQLARTSGDQVALADVLHQHARTVVVFYRGFW
ncbi:MAG TPA: hypothetical protein VF469_35905 [Kofleriaceae bacterium]